MEISLTELLLIFLPVIIIGFLTAGEHAIGLISPDKFDELEDKFKSKEKYKRFIETILELQRKGDDLFATVQISTTLLLVFSSFWGGMIFMNSFLSKIIENYSIIYNIKIILILYLVIFFLALIIWNLSQLLPKSIAAKYPVRISKITSLPMLFLIKILYYPIKSITFIANIILKPFGLKTKFIRSSASEEEIRVLISEGVKSGIIDKNEHEIIENVLEFNDLRANEIMIPRTEMKAVELQENECLIINELIECGHSIIPIYVDSLDNIVGVIHIKDLLSGFLKNEKIEIKSLIRQAYFVPETKLISEILKEMQKRGERIAFVMDEYGGTEGMITIEEILAEIVGDINDSPEEVKDYSIFPDGKYSVLGTITIEEFNETFNFQLPTSDEYTTLAGFIAEKTGKILNTGEIFNYEDLQFELLKKTRQKMELFKVHSTGEKKLEELKKS